MSACLAAGKGKAEGEPRLSSSCSWSCNICRRVAQRSKGLERKSEIIFVGISSWNCSKDSFYLAMNKEFNTQGGTPITTELATVKYP